jgi:RimJ/RimL family protein N-acetyltransferase
LHVRHARADEHQRIRELRLSSLATDPQAFGSTFAHDAAHPPDWWERWATESEDGTTQRTFVAVDGDDRWLGLALVRLDNGADSAWLGAMWVAPEARRGGAAVSLCNACAEWASSRGAGELTLSVVVDNEAARRAYEAAGFLVRGRARGSYHGRTLDELMMARSL